LISQLGLRWRMTLSYLAVSVLAVVVVEVLAIGVVLPQIFGEQDLVSRVQVTALRLAKDVTTANTAADSGGLVLPADYQLGDEAAPAKADVVSYTGASVQIPVLKVPNLPPNSAFEMVVDMNGRVIASSWLSRVSIGADARAFVSSDARALVDGRTGVDRGSEPVVWSTDLLFPSKAGVLKTGKPLAIGWVYVQVPNVLPFGLKDALVGSALQSGLLLLLVSVPLAVVVGILTTRGLLARLDRLGAAGGRLGEGALEQRVEEGPEDEVGRLERRFNLMAARLEAARAEERRAVEEEARTSERSRIARDLHDAVSQDLFSLGMAAGGMEKALPAGPLRERAQAMRETAEGAMQEMSELLLELRPSALERGGLVSALERLSGSYQSRIGVPVNTQLEDVDVSAAGEVAILRLAQEGMSNAVRHAGASSIQLSLQAEDGRAVLTIKDDGHGFDPASVDGHGLGLSLMRDRVVELGGGLSVTSSPGQGTVVEAWLPVSR
jgi:signal transduction histidine kinase